MDGVPPADVLPPVDALPLVPAPDVVPAVVPEPDWPAAPLGSSFDPELQPTASATEQASLVTED